MKIFSHPMDDYRGSKDELTRNLFISAKPTFKRVTRIRSVILIYIDTYLSQNKKVNVSQTLLSKKQMNIN